MSGNEIDIATYFLLSGKIGVSSAALALARAFLEQASLAQPREDWIVTFDWAYSRRRRKTPGGEWQDLGAGLDIAVYPRRRVPDRAIRRIDGMEVAFKMPQRVLEESREQRVDVDPGASAGVRLL